MGSNTSKSRQDVFNKAVTKVSTDVLSTFTSTTDISQQSTSTFDIGLCAEINCSGNVTLSNDVKKSAIVLSEMNIQQQTELQNKLMDAIKTELKKEVDQSNSNFSLGGSNADETVQTLTNIVEADIKTIVKTSVENNININQDANQKFVFNGKMSGDNCTLSNELLLEAVASNISDAVLSTILENDISREIANDIGLSVKQVNEGFNISDLIKGLIGPLVGPVLMFLGVAFGLVVLSFVLKQFNTSGGGGGGGSKKSIDNYNDNYNDNYDYQYDEEY